MTKVVKLIVNGLKEQIKDREVGGLELEQELFKYLLALGRESLEQLEADLDPKLQDRACRTCGERTEDKGRHSKVYRTRFGFVQVRRRGRYCSQCKRTEYAWDRFLGVDPGEGETAAFKEWVCYHTQLSGSFADTVAQLRHDYGIEIEESQVSRILDRVNGHIEPEDLESRKPLQSPERVYIGIDGVLIRSREEGTSKREVKNAVLFTTASPVSEDRVELLDKSYVSTAGELEDFQRRLQDECASRNALAAEEIVILGDGASFIKTVAQSGHLGWIGQFGAERQRLTTVLDPYHLVEKLKQRFGQVFSSGEKAQSYTTECFQLLWQATDTTAYQEVVAKVKTTRPRATAGKAAKAKLLGYLERNQAWIVPYKKYRDAGYIVSAGCIDSAHHTLVTKRMKHKKARWRTQGAQNLINLKVLSVNERWAGFFQARCPVRVSLNYRANHPRK